MPAAKPLIPIPLRLNPAAPTVLPAGNRVAYVNRTNPHAAGLRAFAPGVELRQPYGVIGAGYHAPTHPSPFGSPPMMALPRVGLVGMPMRAGVMYPTPLSKVG